MTQISKQCLIFKKEKITSLATEMRKMASKPVVSTVVPVFICPQSPQNKRRKLTIHDGSSSRAHTNQPHGLGR